MTRTIDVRFQVWAAGLTVLAACQAGWAQPKKEPVDYVNPNIGGIGQMLQPTQPTVQYPYGMMRIAPVTTPGITDRYLADKIYGFPAGGAILMPATGLEETEADRYASMYDHDLETATPYYYAATLEKYDIRVEYTVSRHAAFYRLTFPEGVPAHVLLAVRRGGEIKLVSPTAVSGQEGAPLGRSYFYAEFSRRPSASKVLPEVGIAPERRAPGSTGSGISAHFAPAKGESISIRLGSSYIGIEQARQNLAAEIPGWNFEGARDEARAVWNRELGKITVKGGTEAERTIFYTALYRTLERMNDITEDGKYYSAYDRQVHFADGRRFYTNDGLWDTYRPTAGGRPLEQRRTSGGKSCDRCQAGGFGTPRRDVDRHTAWHGVSLRLRHTDA